jgi:hypothetical protein
MSVRELARFIREGLRRSKTIEVCGLGVFARDSAGDISFSKSTRPRIFIAYAKEDAVPANRLYEDLARHGHAPWLDRLKLLPGQNWPRRIEEAIASSDFFIPCFSRRSVMKRGGFQSEIRYALDCASRVPLDDVFLIPVRLDECAVPRRIQKETQYVDLFPDWQAGLKRILRIIERQRKLERVG